MRFNPNAFKHAHTADLVAPVPPPGDPSSDLRPPTSDISPALAAFIVAYGRPGANQVTIPEGSLAVTLTLTFNDSAPQVDHFDYHAPLGCPAFLVLLVKKQGAKPRFGQTENLARKALSTCPELHALDWTWKSEKYCGGHGNYLQSSYFTTPPALKEHITVHKTFGNGGPDAVSWEIQFASPWRGTALQLWPHRHYGDHPPETDFSNGRHPDPDPIHPSIYSSNCPIVAAWCLNDARRGVEIHFTRRPDDATLAPLRADRAWNYTGRTKCWYARQTDATVAWAKAFCERINGPRSAGVPPAGSTGASPVIPDANREPAKPVEIESNSVPSETNQVPSPVVPSSVVSSPIVPRLPTGACEPRPACRAEASERRPERKIIRFTDTGHEGIGSSRGIVREYNLTVGTWTPASKPLAAAEPLSVPCVPSVPSYP